MNITNGKIVSAQKVVLYGPEGIGKSTFAACFPDPVFIDTEGSTKQMDVRRMDKPTSWAMLLEQVKYIGQNPSICKTLVIDTADWAEQLCINSLCAKYQKNGIEDFGYGKGYVFLAEEFGRLLNLLEDVVNSGIGVVLTAHAMMRKFEQPDEMGAYDRWEMKLGKKTAPLVKEWADMVLFANYKTLTVRTSDNKVKAQGGSRVMYTTHHPCWDAKNRHGLPDELPLDYSKVAEAIEGSSPQSDSNIPDVKVLPNTPTDEPDKPADALEDIVQKAKNQGVPVNENAREFKVDPRIPPKLRDLMEANMVSEGDIAWAVSSKGYFPADMKIWEYPTDYVEGCLIGAWDQVYQHILKERPFVEN